jgi:hypothetical protein
MAALRLCAVVEARAMHGCRDGDATVVMALDGVTMGAGRPGRGRRRRR